MVVRGFPGPEPASLGPGSLRSGEEGLDPDYTRTADTQTHTDPPRTHNTYTDIDTETNRHTQTYPPPHTHRHTAARLDMCHRPSDLPQLTVQATSPEPGAWGRQGWAASSPTAGPRAGGPGPTIGPVQVAAGSLLLSPRFSVATLPGYLVTIRVITASQRNWKTENIAGKTRHRPRRHRHPTPTAPGQVLTGLRPVRGALPFPPRLPIAFIQWVILLLGHLEGPETGPRSAHHCGS